MGFKEKLKAFSILNVFFQLGENECLDIFVFIIRFHVQEKIQVLVLMPHQVFETAMSLILLSHPSI